MGTITGFKVSDLKPYANMIRQDDLMLMSQARSATHDYKSTAIPYENLVSCIESSISSSILGNVDDMIDHVTLSKANYNALSTNGRLPSLGLTYDDNTLYMISDDVVEDYAPHINSLVNATIANSIGSISADIAKQVLDSIYPIGSVYISTKCHAPFSEYGFSWQLISTGKCLQGCASDFSNVGHEIDSGLPSIDSAINVKAYIPSGVQAADSSVDASNKFVRCSKSSTSDSQISPLEVNVVVSPNSSNSIYGKSNTVQPPAYVVSIWKRIG